MQRRQFLATLLGGVAAAASSTHALAQGALGGGVSRSLCLDNYGKALSAAILGFELDVPESLQGFLRGKDLL